MESRQLFVPLGDVEVRLKGEELAKLQLKKALLKAELKAEQADVRADVKRIDDQIHELSRNVSSKTELRAVECDIRRNEEARLIETIRLDSGEQVDSRPMTPAERQTKLFDVKTKAAEAAKAKGGKTERDRA